LVLTVYNRKQFVAFFFFEQGWVQKDPEASNQAVDTGYKENQKESRKSNRVLFFHRSRTTKRRPLSTPPGTKPLGEMSTCRATLGLMKILHFGSLAWRKSS
jgi:hypothetical protein